MCFLQSRFFYSVWADQKLIVMSLNSELLIIDRVSDNENSYKNVINEKIKLVLGWAHWRVFLIYSGPSSSC
jgi:hypothetical protein